MEVVKNRLIMIKDQTYEYEQTISSTTNAIDFIKNIVKIQNEPEEVLVLLGLDNKNNITGFVEVGRGTINSLNTTQREIFKRALIMNCSKIILAHNHPSGDSNPSKADYKFTDNIKKVSKILDIQLVDHIVIGDNDNYSVVADRII